MFWLKPGIHSNLQGYGVYRYANKYGANVDGYSPIYTPDTWSESGELLVPFVIVVLEMTHQHLQSGPALARIACWCTSVTPACW